MERARAGPCQGCLHAEGPFASRMPGAHAE
jgi:hypothetical protein